MCTDCTFFTFSIIFFVSQANAAAALCNIVVDFLPPRHRLLEAGIAASAARILLATSTRTQASDHDNSTRPRASTSSTLDASTKAATQSTAMHNGAQSGVAGGRATNGGSPDVHGTLSSSSHGMDRRESGREGGRESGRDRGKCGAVGDSEPPKERDRGKSGAVGDSDPKEGSNASPEGVRYNAVLLLKNLALLAPPDSKARMLKAVSGKLILDLLEGETMSNSTDMKNSVL